jgi:predicted transcriptional regulator
MNYRCQFWSPRPGGLSASHTLPHLPHLPHLKYRRCAVRAVTRMTVPSNYAATLVGLRRRLGFSQQQLAARIGAASKAVVSQWESGKRTSCPVFWLRVQRL